ncbi:MAG TPA: SDR family oxidoreductase [Puia sp.]|nr:SDR family oxidoreductase [Puia sp.]
MSYNVLVTGGAGFIGSNICERLTQMKEIGLVRVIDNLETGYRENIEALMPDKKFEFVQQDIRDFTVCRQVMTDIDVVLHQAALGSVPRSVQNPVNTNDFNVNGTLNIFFSAKEAGVRKVVFASSSSTYGTDQGLPKREDKIGDPMSPYAVTKLVSELYAKVFSGLYDFRYIGFRYFNVFGPRQSPRGAYAAVIPLFFKETLHGKAPVINGDGKQSRDFTYVDNVVDINVGTIFNDNPESWNNVYNVACGYKTSLNDLFKYIAELTGFRGDAIHGPDRKGDIRDSLADISKANSLLNYSPKVAIREGLKKTFEWYEQHRDFLENNSEVKAGFAGR